jgi:hypothetical protein
LLLFFFFFCACCRDQSQQVPRKKNPQTTRPPPPSLTHTRDCVAFFLLFMFDYIVALSSVFLGSGFFSSSPFFFFLRWIVYSSRAIWLPFV